MSDTIQLRPATATDYDTLGELMYDAIHNGPSQYTDAQSQAWMPVPRQGSDWHARLAKQHVILAVQGHAILGFMSIEPGGYVDFAYIRPRAQGSGLFRRLFAAIMEQAALAGETQLSTHASLMAQPAFAAMGFEIEFHETVEVDGQSLPRAKMVKTL
ncbi:MAG: GNAT family N-acetyltransferase [Pseudomonadota bacterium]